MNAPNIMDGPFAGTFAKVGLAVVRRIGTTDYKRFEEPAGSGRYVWRLRPTVGLFDKIEPEWDQRSPFVRKAAKKPSTNDSE